MPRSQLPVPTSTASTTTPVKRFSFFSVLPKKFSDSKKSATAMLPGNIVSSTSDSPRMNSFTSKLPRSASYPAVPHDYITSFESPSAISLVTLPDKIFPSPDTLRNEATLSTTPITTPPKSTFILPPNKLPASTTSPNKISIPTIAPKDVVSNMPQNGSHLPATLRAAPTTTVGSKKSFVLTRNKSSSGAIPQKSLLAKTTAPATTQGEVSTSPDTTKESTLSTITPRKVSSSSSSSTSTRKTSASTTLYGKFVSRSTASSNTPKETATPSSFSTASNETPCPANTISKPALAPPTKRAITARAALLKPTPSLAKDSESTAAAKSTHALAKLTSKSLSKSTPNLVQGTSTTAKTTSNFAKNTSSSSGHNATTLTKPTSTSNNGTPTLPKKTTQEVCRPKINSAKSTPVLSKEFALTDSPLDSTHSKNTSNCAACAFGDSITLCKRLTKNVTGNLRHKSDAHKMSVYKPKKNEVRVVAMAEFRKEKKEEKVEMDKKVSMGSDSVGETSADEVPVVEAPLGEVFTCDLPKHKATSIGGIARFAEIEVCIADIVALIADTTPERKAVGIAGAKAYIEERTSKKKGVDIADTPVAMSVEVKEGVGIAESEADVVDIDTENLEEVGIARTGIEMEGEAGISDDVAEIQKEAEVANTQNLTKTGIADMASEETEVAELKFAGAEVDIAVVAAEKIKDASTVDSATELDDKVDIASVTLKEKREVQTPSTNDVENMEEISISGTIAGKGESGVADGPSTPNSSKTRKSSSPIFHDTKLRPLVLPQVAFAKNPSPPTTPLRLYKIQTEATKQEMADPSQVIPESNKQQLGAAIKTTEQANEEAEKVVQSAEERAQDLPSMRSLFTRILHNKTLHKILIFLLPSIIMLSLLCPIVYILNSNDIRLDFKVAVPTRKKVTTRTCKVMEMGDTSVFQCNAFDDEYGMDTYRHIDVGVWIVRVVALMVYIIACLAMYSYMHARKLKKLVGMDMRVSKEDVFMIFID